MQIVGMGGGGFSMEPDNPVLDQYFLRQTGKRNPSVCFVPTATGDADGYIVKFYSAFGRLRCRPTHLSLFRPPEDLEAFVLAQDANYVGGGNTKNLLALWREWGLDRIFRTAWRRGVVLGGVSAGLMCWFEQGLTDSITGRMSVLSGLGFLKGSLCPHFDSEAAERSIYPELVAAGTMIPGLALDDGIILHYVGRRLVRVVSSRPSVAAYRIRSVLGAAKIQKVSPTVLAR